jgi:predicted O-linked N-acetylglucosamine transferase (SPINDLY family)
MDNIDLAFAHHQAGRIREAEVLYRQILAQQPDHPDALHLLGALALQAERFDEARALLQQAITLRPPWPEAYNNLGLVLQAQGQRAEAIAAFCQALKTDPGLADAHTNLGLALLEQGKVEDALAALTQALRLRPDSADAHYNLGNALAAHGSIDEAISAFEQALTLDPAHAEACNNLALALQAEYRYVEAQAALERSLRLAPNDPQVHNNLGIVLTSQGLHQAGLEHFRQAHALGPTDADAHSNLFQAMHYSPGFDAEALYTEARRWASCHAEALTRERRGHANERSQERRLRIGYVSSDLRQHPVGFFFAPVVTHHDKQAFELTCYAGVRHPDALTAKFRACADRWHEVTALNDAALAEKIRADGIDILIDLSGHTRGHRLLMFARKPAPIQVAAGGHYDTTGMTTIDYLISDRFHTLAGDERYFSETLIRLSHDYVCYGPPDYAPAVAPLPLTRHGYVTFGCFNNLAKVTARVIALWAKILKALPDARLRLQTRELSDASTCARYSALFKKEGVAASRVELQGHAPHPQLLAAYGEIDIALDPFPYSGGLTTLEALWMGVPVVTLTGQAFCGRHSTSHLNNVGLPELVATSPQDYVERVLALARDPNRLAGLRAGLRAQMAASPLCDAARYTRDLEASYREMWRKYCESSSKSQV